MSKKGKHKPICIQITMIGKAITIQAWTGPDPEGSTSFRLSDFKTIGI
jgi:hypothetical protein